jgi:Ser-tRNA(Ala) deacylase AlaX
MEQQNLFYHRAVITKIGSGEINKHNYHWIQLNETIFHPKGGGQLSDEGSINGIKVVYVYKEFLDKSRIDQFEILHCFNEKSPFKVGDEVELEVDEPIRKLYSKMHTAGHVLANTINETYPELQPYHGNHDPKDGYVKFKMLSETTYSKEETLQEIQPKLHFKLNQDLSVDVTQMSSGMRAIQIGEHAMPCGGTHVQHLREIGQVEITDMVLNKKEKIVTFKYRLHS